MRRLFYVLGIIFTVIVVGLVGPIGTAIHKGSALDADSKAFIEQTVAAVGKDWDQSELLKRASPELLKKASGEQIATLFQNWKNLGGLVHYDGARGQAMMSYFVRKGSTTRAHYEANAAFANGSARFRIDLSRRDTQWMIDGSFVDTSSYKAPALKQI